jgi:hypothetical protein
MRPALIATSEKNVTVPLWVFGARLERPIFFTQILENEIEDYPDRVRARRHEAEPRRRCQNPNGVPTSRTAERRQGMSPECSVYAGRALDRREAGSPAAPGKAGRKGRPMPGGKERSVFRTAGLATIP